ncbi:pyruvate kinase [Corynebacterium singulare]|uniref:pyruvate kinase n=1 Tax=Corynebacterium singulare TaxID=161899 RepID=A0A0B6F279_9CORY|nr:pyruvate kinase [Corynebacterium singulare]AJI78116.1 pyruvate kinase [Corynebacterium singulare]
MSSLRPRLDALIDRVEKATAEYTEPIAKVAPNHRPGAVNLVRYMALRSQDAVEVQEGLSALGATSLSHPEPAVLERLHAARNVLDAFDGQAPTYPMQAIATAYADADDILDANTEALLGPTQEGTHARIMVTLPSEAAEDYDLVLGFARAGMELARINCAHDGEAAWEKMVEHVHRAAAEVGREILISCDIAGPKVRTGAIEPGPRVVRVRGERSAAGELLSPPTLVLYDVPQAEKAQEVAKGASASVARPAIAVEVDGAWLTDLEPGSEVRFTEARGRSRSFTVESVEEDVAVLRGERNCYLAEGTVLSHGAETTQVRGVPALEQKIRLHRGDELVLSTSQEPARIAEGEVTTIGCTIPEVVTALEVGHAVIFDDGAISGRVTEIRTQGEDREAVIAIEHAGPNGTNLAAYKGINLPETDIPLPSLTEEDIAALRFVATHCDIAAVSFIRTPADVSFLYDTLDDIAAAQESEDMAQRVRNLGVVLKIETVPAYEQLGTVLLEGMRHEKFGIMIARGDLAVELGFERMVQVPGRIMKVAEAAHIPVIMATQVLETLAKTGLPSRAEITDAGYALRAECVMLNKGPHITEAIQILDRMSRKLGRSRLKNRQMLRKVGSWTQPNG